MMVATRTDFVIFPAKKLDRGRIHKIHEIRLEIAHSKQDFANISEKYKPFPYNLLQLNVQMYPFDVNCNVSITKSGGRTLSL